MDKLERLRTLLTTASDRPWEAIVSDSPKYMSTVQFEYLNGTAGTVALVGASNLSQQNTNAELIAEGINAMPALLDEITRLKGEVAECRAALVDTQERSRARGALIDELVEGLERVLASSGARGRYHALEHADAVEAAEALISKARSSGKAGSDA